QQFAQFGIVVDDQQLAGGVVHLPMIAAGARRAHRIAATAVARRPTVGYSRLQRLPCAALSAPSPLSRMRA
ncbi:MAG: hypothetical protein KJ011_18125, partial [Burkholderiaceae bacterium]|nr:hypothetical protein [Burkholderiaceae bacterium]